MMARYTSSYLEMRDLLENCQNYAAPGKFDVEFVSPDMDFERYRELLRTYPELKKQASSSFEGGGGYGRGILITYGQSVVDVREGEPLPPPPHVFIADRDLEEGPSPMGGSQTRAFRGEKVLMENIQLLANEQKKVKVYFTQLNGELWINDLDSEGRISDPRFIVGQINGGGALVKQFAREPSRFPA